MTGIADAQLDSVPIVCITGQVVKPQLGYDAFQETDVVGFSMPVTKWNYQITSASEIASVMAKAFYIARSGRPGPVLLDITKDAQTQIIEKFEYKKCTKIRSYHPKLKPSETSVNEAATLLNNAQRPLMIVGHGVLLSGCQDEVKELAEKLDMPVASTLLGLSSVENDNPLFVGMVGLHGNYAANMMTNRCDVLLAVGMRFSDRVIGNPEKYATQAAVIHIEIDPSEVGKIISPAVGIVSDAKSALQKILPLIRKSSHISWLNQMREFQAKENETVINENLSKLRMGKAVRVVSEKKSGSTAVVADVGQNQMASARYFSFQPGDSIITSGGLGTMGFALPASIGAAYTKKFQNVVCIMGDGGFQMTIEELGTIMQYKLPVKILLLNNNYLGMIRQLQDLYYNSHYYFGEMQNPDFVKIVEAYGIKAEKVDSLEALEPAVKRMMDYNGAYFLEVRVEKQENIYPVIPSGKAVDEMLLTPNN